jgi:hypothetical protein
MFKKIINAITNWEAWPFWLIYAPIAWRWLYMIIRLRSVWFFTPSNPKITFGGLEGEPKQEMYNLLPTQFYPTTTYIQPNQNINEVSAQLQQAGINYPFVVKPNFGSQGVLFRKIYTAQQLATYHGKMQYQYIAQSFVKYPMEVSVFYIRHPKQTSGTITGFLHKIPLRVTGNGVNTLAQLVHATPKAAKRASSLALQHAANWQTVIPNQTVYNLSYAANHNRGAQFINLASHIDATLLKIFDNLSLNVNDFFYGRYDILCQSIEDLKAGKNFLILEYNGCGAEPNHFYDTGYTYPQALAEIKLHWQHLFKISKYNTQQGIKPWPFLKGLQFLQTSKAEFKKMKILDTQIP